MKYIIVSLLTHITFVQTAFAEDPATPPTPINLNLYNPLGLTATIPSLISRLFIGLVYLAAFIAPIFIIYGAFQMLTSAGNVEKFGAGKKTILYTVIGFMVVLAAQGIVEIVKKVLTV
jgi:hypothetical protein